MKNFDIKELQETDQPTDQRAVENVAWRATNDSTSGFTRWGASSLNQVNR